MRALCADAALAGTAQNRGPGTPARASSVRWATLSVNNRAVEGLWNRSDSRSATAAANRKGESSNTKTPSGRAATM